MSKPIAFIIGAGKNIGASTAQALRSKGYRVAQAARSVKPEDSKDDTLLLNVDLTKPQTVNAAFTRLRETWGEPGVVIYNAGAAHFTDKSDPLSVSAEDFASDLAINTISAFTAAKEAVASFEALPSSAAKAFLYTGNKLNEGPMPGGLTLGVGKSATAHLIQIAAQAYAEKGWKFHYVDERTSQGLPVYSKIDGPAHADFFVGLIEGTVTAPWNATFVKGEGYKSFPRM